MQALTQLKAVLNYFGDRLSLTPKERSAFNRLMNLNSNPNREAGDLKVQILKMCKTLGLDT